MGVKRLLRQWAWRAALLAAMAAGSPLTHAQVSPAGCGPLSNGENGPFDYRTERGRKLAVVEEFHFNPKVEALISGQTGAISQDLDYVLRAFPNHHRALVSMARLAKRSNAVVAPGAPLSVECYFERALRFKPDDTTTRMLLANFLHDGKRDREAEEQLDTVIRLGGDNAFTQYNVGMIFAEMGLYDRALAQAHEAVRLGFPRTELRQRLQQAGRWRDPTEAATAAPSASAASQP